MRPIGAQWPTAATALFGVIGYPARHSLSPVLHNAALEALGLDAVYLAFEVEVGQLQQALEGAAALGVAGLSVTMPHKEAAAAWATSPSTVVSKLGAANTLTFGEAEVRAESTDGVGFINSLAEEGVALKGKRVVVLGAGGAARSVALAVVMEGASDVAIVARRPQAAAAAAEAIGPLARAGGPGDVAGCDIVVNATPLGMAGGPGEGLSPLAEGMLGRRHVVVDLVYHPSSTPLLAQAQAAGAHCVGGAGMLLHQAAEQLRIWTSLQVPIEPMRSALKTALARRPRG